MKVALLDHNQIMTDVAPHLDITSDLQEADTLLYWQDIYGTMNIDIRNANEDGKKTFVFEHGINSYRDYIPPYNHELIANKILLMGEVGKEELIKHGIDPERLIVVGSTLYDRLSTKQKHEQKTILFAPIHWNGDIEENKEVAEKLREIADKHGFKVITKVMEDHNKEWYDNPIYSDRNYPDHLKTCGDALSQADVVVGYKEGTFESFAYSMDIPLVIVDHWKPKELLGVSYDKICGNLSHACVKADLDDLEKAIVHEIEYPHTLKDYRWKWLEKHAGFGLEGTALERILNAIK